MIFVSDRVDTYYLPQTEETEAWGVLQDLIKGQAETTQVSCPSFQTATK